MQSAGRRPSSRRMFDGARLFTGVESARRHRYDRRSAAPTRRRCIATSFRRTFIMDVCVQAEEARHPG